MAYSRWSTSTWYTYWAYYESMQFKFPSTELKEKQVFEICDFPSMSLTYGQIKGDGIFDTLMLIKKFYDERHEGKLFLGYVDGVPSYEETEWPEKKPTAEELNELKSYLEKFIDDVDNHFKLLNFFKYEWVYPMKISFKKFFRIK